MTDTANLSRRRLLASMPAAAAAMAPATAVALTSLPIGHLSASRIEDLIRLLNMLDGMPPDEANKVLTAITDAIGRSMRNRAHAAELMALKPRLDAAIAEAWDRHQDSELHREAFEAELERRTGLPREEGWTLDRDSPEFEAWKTARIALVDEGDLIPRRYPDRSDEEVNRDADEFYGLISQILEYWPLTPEGLALQCRALIADFWGEWDHGNNGKIMRFIAVVAAYFNKDLELPPALADEVFGNDEDEEDEEGTAAA